MYEYVINKEVKFAREKIESVILKVQDYLRRKDILTFQFNLVGSASKSRHLVTRVVGGNKGFDMDYNIVIQKINESYNDAKIVKNQLIQAFNKFLPKEFNKCEDSSSVITIKKVDKQNSRITYSYDFAIVHYFEEELRNPDFDEEYNDPDEEYFVVERQEYISFDKKGNYSWEVRPLEQYNNHRYIEQVIKQKGLWNELRDLYLEYKNAYPEEKSRIIYYETLDQIWQKYFE